MPVDVGGVVGPEFFGVGEGEGVGFVLGVGHCWCCPYCLSCWTSIKLGILYSSGRSTVGTDCYYLLNEGNGHYSIRVPKAPIAKLC